MNSIDRNQCVACSERKWCVVKLEYLHENSFPDSRHLVRHMRCKHMSRWKTLSDLCDEKFTPNIHSLVIRADFIEIILIDGEESASLRTHRWKFADNWTGESHDKYKIWKQLKTQITHYTSLTMVGVLSGAVLSLFLRCISLDGTRYHLKFNFQLNPPHVWSDAVTYSNVSSLMTSMMGHTTVRRSIAILASSGSSHPSVHSQWASRNVITCPLTFAAPMRRARMRPERFPVLRTEWVWQREWIWMRCKTNRIDSSSINSPCVGTGNVLT